MTSLDDEIPPPPPSVDGIYEYSKLIPPVSPSPEVLHTYCLGMAHLIFSNLPPSSRSREQLIWSSTVAQAHLMEVALRAYGTNISQSSDFEHVIEAAVKLATTPIQTCQTELFDLWCAWRNQHPDWPEQNTLDVPMHFLAMLHFRNSYLQHLIQQSSHLPVFKGWVSLRANSAVLHGQFLIDRFLSAMDRTLYSTLSLKLARSEGAHQEEGDLPDADHVALLGAAEGQDREQTRIVGLFRRGGSVKTKSGQTIQIPIIPPLEVLGMEQTDGENALWRAIAEESAFQWYATFAPGILGTLETVLADSAHAAQRRERNELKRDGIAPQESDAVTPADEYNTMWYLNDKPGTETAARNEPVTAAFQDTVETELEIALIIQRAEHESGIKGRKVLRALLDGHTMKKAAQLAGVSTRTAYNYRKELALLLKPL